MAVATLLDIDDISWTTQNAQELVTSDSGCYLTDTVLDFHQDINGNDYFCQEEYEPVHLAGMRNHMHSAIIEDHMYSLSWRSKSTELTSCAASTSGYSSDTESLISNDENSVNLLSLTQSSTSLLTQQAHSLLKQRSLLQTQNVSAVELSSTKRKSRKQVKCSTASSVKVRKWSKMSEDEQKASIIELTQIISSQLGMREKLEAIRILNPHSTVSPTDGEFVIDMKPISDTRFAKLRKFVKLHTDEESSMVDNITTPSTFCHQQSASSSWGSSNPLTGCSKIGRKRRSRGSHQEQKMHSQMSREQQQRAKEIESGLFLKEVRICVRHTTEAEDEDDNDEHIDILD